MEELQPQELEKLVQELEEEDIAQEALSPEIEELLRKLQSGSLMYARKAAEQLGKVGTSSPRIVQALIAACESDAYFEVSGAVAKALRAPVHQEILQEYPDLMQRREEQREKQRAIAAREEHNRKEPKVGLWIPWFIIGIVWVCASGIATAQSQSDFWCFPLLALPGVAVVAFALWGWRAATMNREVLDRTAKETVGTIENLRKSVSRNHYGSTTFYYATVCFEAEDAKMGTRVMVLEAQVAHRLWWGFRVGERVRIHYAAEDPRIALIEGEW